MVQEGRKDMYRKKGKKRSLNSNPNPPRRDIISIFIVLFVVVKVVVGRQPGLIAFTRRQPEPRSRGYVVTKLTAASHIHLQDHHAQEISVLSGLSLTRHWRNLGIERAMLSMIAAPGASQVESALAITATRGSAIGLHLNGYRAVSGSIFGTVRVFMVDMHLCR